VMPLTHMKKKDHALCLVGQLQEEYFWQRHTDARNQCVFNI
jgi:hypothetical protein